MKRDEIMANLLVLSRNQGLYGNIYCHMLNMKENNPVEYDGYMSKLEKCQFKDILGLVEYFEG